MDSSHIVAADAKLPMSCFERFRCPPAGSKCPVSPEETWKGLRRLLRSDGHDDSTVIITCQWIQTDKDVRLCLYRGTEVAFTQSVAVDPVPIEGFGCETVQPSTILGTNVNVWVDN